jgi:hypothetical protein
VEKANAERRQEAKNRQMGEGDQASGYCGSLKGAAGPRRDLITQRRLPTRLSRRGIRNRERSRDGTRCRCYVRCLPRSFDDVQHRAPAHTVMEEL